MALCFVGEMFGFRLFFAPYSQKRRLRVRKKKNVPEAPNNSVLVSGVLHKVRLSLIIAYRQKRGNK